jgi:hypothetical protein
LQGRIDTDITEASGRRDRHEASTKRLQAYCLEPVVLLFGFGEQFRF